MTIYMFVRDGFGWGRWHIADAAPVGPEGGPQIAAWCGRWANSPAGQPKVRLTTSQRTLKRMGVPITIRPSQRPKPQEWPSFTAEPRTRYEICGRCERIAASRGIELVYRPSRLDEAPAAGGPAGTGE